MPENKKQLTKEEIVKLKEGQREYALKNLESNLVDVGASYLVHKTKDFGEADNSAMEQYKYFPAFTSGLKAYDENGKEYDVMQNSLLQSREDSERYSGNISEVKIMKECAGIINESVSRIKVSDLVKLMGSEMTLKKELKDAYMSDLIPSRLSKEEFDKLTPEQKKARKTSEEFYTNLIESYQVYLAKTKVLEAMAESAKEIPRSLEAILAEPKNEDTK